MEVFLSATVTLRNFQLEYFVRLSFLASIRFFKSDLLVCFYQHLTMVLGEGTTVPGRQKLLGLPFHIYEPTESGENPLLSVVSTEMDL